MGLFKRGARPTSARVLRAAGQRIDPSARDGLKALSATVKQQGWQKEAWAYRDLIGELRLAVQFLARAVSRVTFFPAQANPSSDQPIPFDAEEGVTLASDIQRAAQEHLARLPLSSGYRFTGVFTENLIIVGEAWLNGFERMGQEVWEVRSIDEIHISGEGKITIREMGKVPRDFTGESEELLRNWVPHPRWNVLADSPMRPILNSCEDIILAGMEGRAASRSRVAANGILKVPVGLTMFSNTREDGEMISSDDNAFMGEMTAAFLAPINNESDPGSVMPVMVVGDVADLEGLKHMTLERAGADDLILRQEAGLKRLARGMDLPPEQMTGMGEMNHWSLWGVDMQTYRNHIDPWVRTVADSLLEGFLRPALLADGFAPEEVAKVVIDADASALTENVNRSQDAKDAYDRGALNRVTLAEALGFDATSLPDDEELLRIIAVKQGVDSQTAAIILQRILMGDPLSTPIVIDSTLEGPAQAEEPAQENPAGPGQAPGSPMPAQPSLVAAGAGELPWRTALQESQRLADLDRGLRDQILAAADPIIRRAVEKANSRLRSLAHKNVELRDKIAGKELWEIAPTLGREGLLALGVDERELLREALDDLETRFVSWTGDTIDKVVTTVAKLLGYTDPDSPGLLRVKRRLAYGMERRINGAWSKLRNRLTNRVEKYLFDPTPYEQPGEVPDTIVPPAYVRAALAEIGGMPQGSSGVDDEGQPLDEDDVLGGIGTGQEVTDLIIEEGGERLGFEWRYGITPLTRQFPPHRIIDGRRFVSSIDPALSTVGTQYDWVGPYFHPGDHAGCLCDSMPIWAVPEYDRLVSERLAEDTPAMRNIRALAESDDRAGRTGTTAQKTRDERDQILELQKRYITKGARND